MILDYHDDVVVFDSATAPKSMEFFQVKTRGQAKGAWKMKELIHRPKRKDKDLPHSMSILGKLYAHHVDFGPLVKAVIFISNAQYAVQLRGDSAAKPMDKFEIDQLHPDHFKEISDQLEQEHSLGHCPTTEIQITFAKDSLSLEDHTAHAKGRFEEFATDFLGIENCPTTHAYNAVIQAMRTKQNWEPKAESSAELVAKKGFSQSEFADAINKLRKHSGHKSWSAFEAILVQEAVDILTLRRMRDAWDRVTIQSLDSTNHVLRAMKSAVQDAVNNRLKLGPPKPLKEFIDEVATEILPHIESRHLPFDQTVVSAMILTVLDEYPTE